VSDYIDQYKVFYDNNGYDNNDPVIRAKNTIEKHIKDTNSNTLMDYGCGLCTHYDKHRVHDQWGITEENLYRYDPAIEKYSVNPDKVFDAVINTDVMEHIPEPYVDDVIQDIFKHSSKLVYFSIATSPAKAILPNGENAHCTLKTHQQWCERISKFKGNQKVVVETWGRSPGSTILS